MPELTDAEQGFAVFVILVLGFLAFAVANYMSPPCRRCNGTGRLRAAHTRGTGIASFVTCPTCDGSRRGRRR